MRKRNYWLIVACLLFMLEEAPIVQHRWVADESWYSIPGYTFLQQGMLRNPTFPGTDHEFHVDMRPPAMPLTLASSFAVFHTGVIQARLPSLIAGLVLVVLVYLLGTQLAGPAAGGVAAILVATDNFVFLSARTVRPEIFVALFSVAATLLYLRSRKTGSLIASILAGMSLGLAFDFHVTAIPAICSMALLLLFDSKYAIWKERRALGMLFGVLLLLAPFVVRTHLSPAHYAAYKEMYGRGERASTVEKLRGERIRYSDFIGLSSQRFNLPFRFPLRAHIAVAIVAALLVLYRYQRNNAYLMLLFIAPNLLFWLYLVNKSSRYFAVTAPWFALALACAAVALPKRRLWTWGAVATCTVVALSQVAGNAAFLYRARDASYGQVATSLRRLIGPQESAYGAITFWMALHDRTYYSYDRMPLDYAISCRHPSYLILGDRVMMHGSGYGIDDFADLRQHVQTFVQANGTIIGTVPDPFYGSLEVYKIRYAQETAPCLEGGS